jgi:FtsZ-interacting cell division protein ZipA
MSDLQIVLIIIGALIILAVVVINWWQERRFHQQVERSFSTPKSDALLDDPQLNPTEFSADLNDPYAFADVDASLPAHNAEEPRLNYEDYDKNEIDDFAINDYADEAVLEDAYDSLPDYIKAPVEADEVLDVSTHDTPKKSPQHEDIKAIFVDAFSDKKTPEPVSASQAQVSNEAAFVVPDADSSLPAMVHAQMDLTALLYLPEATPLGQFAEALMGLFDGYDKPVFIHVQDVNKEWYLLKEAAPNVLITKVASSLQLADRGGAVSRHTLNRFQLAVETIGLDINAHVEWQSTGDALTVANALDAFCIEVDKTIGFHLVHGESGAFTGTKLRGLAESQGLSLANGMFQFMEDAQARQLYQASFTMFNREDYPFSPEMLRSSVVKGVTFQMDIPHVKHCAEAFNTMVQVARQMEIGLNATLVDDNNKVLGEMQIEKIRQQLKVIHATMLVRGIVPGSESAHRLFT